MQLAHYSRFPFYDYARGASLFITLSTAPRRRLFGDVVAGEMHLSSLGHGVVAALKEAVAAAADGRFAAVSAAASTSIVPAAVPCVRLYGHVVMPDHVHFRLYLVPGFDNAGARRLLNRLVGRFKSATTHLFAKESGVSGPIWQQGYHDWLCLGREMIDSVERYMAYNALKWWLRHGAGRRLMALHEPLHAPRLGLGEYWRGVGSVELLTVPASFVALRVSRRCNAADVAALVARLKAKAGNCIVASGFISAGERAALSALLAEPKARIVKVLANALPHDYAPPVAYMPAIAEGRMAVIAHGNDVGPLSRTACLDLNARLVEMADRAAYVQPGAIKWLK